VRRQLALGIFLFWMSCSLVLMCHQSRATSEITNPAQSIPSLLNAKSLDTEEARMRIGKELLHDFSKSDEDSKLQIQRAMALAYLKYVPAIPEMINKLELQDSSTLLNESAVDVVFPCVRALALYGDAAVPYVVEAYLIENSESRKGLLLNVIKIGGMKSKVQVYIREFVSSREGEITKARAKNLLQSFQ